MKYTLDNIDKLIDKLTHVKERVEKAAPEIANRMTDIGVEVAKESVKGEWKHLVFFRVDQEETHKKTTMIVTNTITAYDQKILSLWQGRGNTLTGYPISPLLLSEFGSGWLSDVKFESMEGLVGQGTMPNAKGHAFEPMGWAWRDLEGKYHRSIGVRPTHPLYNAFMAMIDSVPKIADEVFDKYRD